MNETFSRFFKQAPESSDLKQLKDKLQTIERELDEKDILEEINLVEKDYVLNSGSGFSEDFTVVGEDIDLASLQKFYATEPWAYAVINVIARTIASLPIKMEKRKIQKERIEDTNESVYREVWVDASAEPEATIAQYPNDAQVPMEFYMLLLIDLLATGNCYIYVDNGEAAVDIERPQSRLEEVIRSSKKCKTKGLWRLNAALVEPTFDDESLEHKGYTMQTAEGQVDFSRKEIIHIRMPNPLNPIMGLSPMSAVLKNVMIDRFTAEHMIRFYKQGARLGGVIKTEKKLTKEQLTRLTRSFDSNFTGKRNHHKTLILPQGMDYEIIEQNPGETSLIEFGRYNKEAILSAYGVPPIKVGLLDGATYANALVQEREFWTDCVLPLKCLFESGINNSEAFLRTQRNLRMSWSTAHVEVLKEDLKAKGEVAELMARAGLSINEIREQVWGRKKIDGGDVVPLLERTKLEGARSQTGANILLSAPQGEHKADPAQAQPDNESMTDIEPTRVTYEQRVEELVRISIGHGIPLGQAIASAITQAINEGFSPRVEPEESAPKPTEEAQDELANGKDAEEEKRPAKYDHIDFKPPQGVADAAKRGLELRDEYGRGGTATGIARARDLSNRENMTPDTIKRMVSFFARHEDNKDTPPEEGNGMIAWLLWGGDPGQTWSNKVYGQMQAADEKEKAEGKQPPHDERYEKLQEYCKNLTGKPVIAIMGQKYEATLQMFSEMKKLIKDDIEKIDFSDPKVSELFKKSLTKQGDDDPFKDLPLFQWLEDFAQSQADKFIAPDVEATEFGFDRTLTGVDSVTFPNQEAQQTMRERGAEQVRNITETTRQHMRRVITRAYEEQQPPQEMAARVEEYFNGIPQGRAITIARTETLTAVSEGQKMKIDKTQQEIPQLKGKLKKRWITAQDDRVRDLHVIMDGEVVKEDEEFSNGLMYPRETGSPAAESINCRCAVHYFHEEDEGAIDEILPRESVVDEAIEAFGSLFGF